MVDLPAWCSQKSLEQYVGGHLSILNPYRDYAHHGEIASLALADAGTLTITFVWEAMGVDRHNRSSLNAAGGWVLRSKPRNYCTTLFTLPSARIPGDKLMLLFTQQFAGAPDLLMLDGGELMEEFLIFFPPGRPTLAEGLVRPADPENPVNENPRRINQPTSRVSLWKVEPDGQQTRIAEI